MTQIPNARAARTGNQTLTAESSIFKNTLKAKPLRNAAKINQDPDTRESSQPGDIYRGGNVAHKPRQKILRQPATFSSIMWKEGARK